jgi:hypothetical protein
MIFISSGSDHWNLNVQNVATADATGLTRTAWTCNAGEMYDVTVYGYAQVTALMPTLPSSPCGGVALCWVSGAGTINLNTAVAGYSMCSIFYTGASSSTTIQELYAWPDWAGIQLSAPGTLSFRDHFSFECVPSHVNGHFTLETWSTSTGTQSCAVNYYANAVFKLASSAAANGTINVNLVNANAINVTVQSDQVLGFGPVLGSSVWGYLAPADQFSSGPGIPLSVNITAPLYSTNGGIPSLPVTLQDSDVTVVNQDTNPVPIIGIVSTVGSTTVNTGTEPFVVTGAVAVAGTVTVTGSVDVDTITTIVNPVGVKNLVTSPLSVALTGGVIPSELEENEYWYTWSATKKRINKLMHALNGNSSQKVKIVNSKDEQWDLIEKKDYLLEPIRAHVRTEKTPTLPKTRGELRMNVIKQLKLGIAMGGFPLQNTYYILSELSDAEDVKCHIPDEWSGIADSMDGDDFTAAMAQHKKASSGKTQNSGMDEEAKEQRSRKRKAGLMAPGEQLENVTSRIVRKARSPCLFARWLIANRASWRHDVKKRQFAKAIFDKAKAQTSWAKFEDRDSDLALGWATLVLTVSDPVGRWNRLAALHPIMREALQSIAWTDWSKFIWSVGTDSTGRDYYTCAHDHCTTLMGDKGSETNTDDLSMKVANMKDIEDCVTLMNLVASGKSSNVLIDTMEVLGRLSGLRQNSGLITDSGTRALVGQLQYVQYNNTLISSSQIPFPFSTLFPRTIRNGVAAALVNSGDQITPILTSSQVYKGTAKISETPSYTSGVDIRTRRGYIALGAASIDGFLFNDVVAIGEGQPVMSATGTCMFKVFLKMHLLMHTLRHTAPYNTMPVAGLFQTFDPNTQIYVAGPAIQMGINNSPVFGEDCGNNADVPTYPFFPAQGQLWFHNSSLTIPSAARATATAVPIWWLNLTQALFPSLGYAAWIFLWIMYPHAFRTVSAATTDTAGGNIQNQLFIPFSEQVMILGQTDLHVIIPCSADVAQLTTQIGANSRPTYRPQFGLANYAARGGAAPGTLVNMQVLGDANAGQPANAIQLIPFLLSHFDPAAGELNTGILAQMISILAANTGAHDDNDAAAAFANLLLWRCSRNQFCNTGTTTAQTMASIYRHPNVANGICPIGLNNAGNYPIQTPAISHVHIPDYNPLTMLQRFIGATAWVSRGTPKSAAQLGSDPFALARSATYPLLVATACDVLYRAVGLTSYHWANLFSTIGQNMESITREFGDFFLSGMHQTAALEPNVVVKAEVWRKAFTAVTGYGLPEDSLGGHFFSYWQQPVPSQTYFMTGGRDTVANTSCGSIIPQIVSDFWHSIGAMTLPLAMQQWPTPLQRQTGIFDGKATNIFNPATGNASVFTNRQIQIVGTDEFPIIDDIEIHNTKSIYHDARGAAGAAGGYLADFLGNLYAGASPVPSNGTIWVQPYAYTPEATYFPNPLSNVIANTNSCWIPTMDEIGRNIYLYFTAANRPYYNQVLVKKAFLQLEAGVFTSSSVAATAPSGGGRSAPPAAFSVSAKSDALNSKREQSDKPAETASSSAMSMPPKVATVTIPLA